MARQKQNPEPPLARILKSAVSPDRLFGRVALLVAAGFPLVAVVTTEFLSSEPESAVVDVAKKPGEDPRLMQFCINNMKSNRAFVVFQNGTCIIVENESSSDKIREIALNKLVRTAKPDAKFVCSPIENHNLIVSYSEPVFHLRFADEMSKHRISIDTDFKRFLTKQEISEIPAHWQPPFHAKVGLRSRARLMMDAENPVIAHIIAPRGTKKGSPEEIASASH